MVLQIMICFPNLRTCDPLPVLSDRGWRVQVFKNTGKLAEETMSWRHVDQLIGWVNGVGAH
jgi:hypothetical protein